MNNYFLPSTGYLSPITKYLIFQMIIINTLETSIKLFDCAVIVKTQTNYEIILDPNENTNQLSLRHINTIM